jgi:hypothetical protein
MTRLKTALAGGAFAAVVAVGALAATSTPAAAEVACNRWGDCWTVRTHYNNYPRAVGVIFHNDAWRATHVKRYHWRTERADHGYWRNGVWVRF